MLVEKGKLKINKDITYQKIGDLTIVVNLDSGDYYNLNQTGLAVLELIKYDYSTEDIVAALSKRYPNANIKDDVRHIIEEFVKRNILIYQGA